MTDRSMRIYDEDFSIKLRVFDRKTRLHYEQCSANELDALRGHPLYSDVSTPPKKKAVSETACQVSNQVTDNRRES
jgi:hypothetical protein